MKNSIEEVKEIHQEIEQKDKEIKNMRVDVWKLEYHPRRPHICILGILERYHRENEMGEITNRIIFKKRLINNTG